MVKNAEFYLHLKKKNFFFGGIESCHTNLNACLQLIQIEFKKFIFCGTFLIIFFAYSSLLKDLLYIRKKNYQKIFNFDEVNAKIKC